MDDPAHALDEAVRRRIAAVWRIESARIVATRLGGNERECAVLLRMAAAPS